MRHATARAGKQGGKACSGGTHAAEGGEHKANQCTMSERRVRQSYLGGAAQLCLSPAEERFGVLLFALALFRRFRVDTSCM